MLRKMKSKNASNPRICICRADELFKSVANFQDVLFDPKTAFSEEVNETGFQKALGIDVDQWSYYESPEGQYRGSRFAAAMSASSKLHPPQAVLSGKINPSSQRHTGLMFLEVSTGHLYQNTV